jgi:hypothetical protein
MSRIVLKPTVDKLALVTLDKRGQANNIFPPVTGHDGYAIIEVGGVPAFRPIRQSYIVPGFNINSFGGPVGVVEVGATISSPSFSASYSEAPSSASIVDDQGNPVLDVSLTPTSFVYPHSYARTGNNAAVTWALTATLVTEISSRSVSTVWRPQLYYGIGAAGGSDEAFIKALANQPLAASRDITFTVAPGAGQFIYYAAPTSYGSPTFFVGSFEGGFDFIGTIAVTNVHGVTENYDLWRSHNPNLGSTTVEVQ